MLELRVFGTLDLRTQSGGPIHSVLAQPKRAALLAYLCLAGPGRSQRRDTLLSVFWPESSLDRARNSLNQALFVLRRALGPDVVVTRGAEEVGIDTEQLWCDAAAFERALEAGDRKAALDLYRGDLLEGFFLSDAIAFERWVEEMRAGLRHRAIAAALELSSEYDDQGNAVEAVFWTRRAAALARDDEAVLRRLLTLLLNAGDRVGAVREYESFRDRLANEMELEPAPETAALIARVHARGTAPASGAAQDVTAAERVTQVTPVLSLTGEPPATPHRAMPWAPAVVAALALSGALLWHPWRRRATSSTPTAERVLVSAFVNRTGDSTLDPLSLMAGDWITQGLTRSGMVRVIPFSAVLEERRTVAAEARSIGEDPAAAALAHRLGASLLVTGAFYARGDSVVLQSRIVSVQTGEVLRAVDEVAAPKSAPDRGVEALRQHVLGALATLTDPRLASWPDPGDLPPGLESYDLFARGLDRFLAADRNRELATPDSESKALNREAATLFVEAAGPDSAFVEPLVWAVFALQNAGYDAAADSLLGALQQRTDLSAWDRALMELQVAFARRDFDEAYRRAQTVVELSPGSEWQFVLASVAYDGRRYHTAIAALERIDPDRGWIKDWSSYWHLRIEARHSVGDHERELADVKQLEARFPGDLDAPRMELLALAALGRSDQLMSRVREATASGNDHVTRWLAWISEACEAHGHEKTAEQVRSVGLAYFRAPPPAGREEFWLASRARLLTESAQWDSARVIWERLAKEHPHTTEYQGRLGVLAARRGDRAEAARVDAWLQHVNPSDFGDDGGSLLWRARIAAQLGERDHAIQLIHEALHLGLTHSYLLLHAEKDFDPLRSYPPFAALLKSRD